MPLGSLRNHIIFWILYIGFTVGIYYVKEPDLVLHLVYEMASLPAKLMVVYGTLYIVVPRYMLPRKYGRSTLIMTVFLIVGTIVLQLCVSSVVYPLFFPAAERNLISWDMGKLISPLLDLIIVSSLALVVKLLRDRERVDRNRLQLEKASIRHELQLLKSQLQPHFLFNTLNGLYTCTLEDPALASRMVLKLSDLLRYIIYEGSSPYVSLQAEMESIDNYVELERLRYGDRLEANIEVKGNPKGKEIQPLLLMPIIENAFKHRKAGSAVHKVIGEIEVTSDTLHLRLENTTNADRQVQHSSESGVGLQNVKQLLKHHFGTAFQLHTSCEEETYRVALSLPIRSL